MRKLRHTALNLADELGIEAKLEDRPAFGFAGQLGVDGFIGPTAEIARRIDLPEDVGATDPCARTQSALHDDLNASAHGLVCRCNSFIRNFNTVDTHDVQPEGCQVLDIVLLMFGPAFPQSFEQRIVVLGFRQLTLGNGVLKTTQVPTIEVADQIGRAEAKLIILDFHGGCFLQ